MPDIRIWRGTSGLESRDQRLRGGRRADLRTGDKIDEYVATLGPGAGAFRPAVERAGLIAGLGIFIRAHQPGIGKVCRLFVDTGIIIAVGKNDCRVVAARQIVKRFMLKAFVPHFECMAKPNSLYLARQKREESFQIVRVELLGRCELPVYRTQPVAQFRYALREKFRD